MNIYLVEVLEDPVLLVINIYFIFLNCITQISHPRRQCWIVGNYLLKIYEDIFSRSP